MVIVESLGQIIAYDLIDLYDQVKKGNGSTIKNNIRIRGFGFNSNRRVVWKAGRD